MFPLIRIASLLTAATLAAGAVTLVSATAVPPALTENHLPLQGFSQTLGSKQAVAYFEEDNGRCRIILMVVEAFDETSDRPPPSAARITTTIDPTQSTMVESVEKSSLKITCGKDAKSVSVEKQLASS